MTDIIEPSRWHVARHRPYEGQAIVERAREAGFQAVQPRQVVRRPGRDDTMSPVFPGYLLVAWTARQDWTALLRHPVGALGVLTTMKGDPAALPAGFVPEFMREADAAGVFPWWWPSEPPRGPADRLGRSYAVQSGAWASFMGRCVSSNKNRLSLLLSLFGRETVVEFRAEQVREIT